MFDRALYWRRRKQNKRGQGAEKAPAFTPTGNPVIAFDSKGKPHPLNRKQRRTRIIDRSVTKQQFKHRQRKHKHYFQYPKKVVVS